MCRGRAVVLGMPLSAVVDEGDGPSRRDVGEGG